MVEYDTNGFRVHPGHDGNQGPHTGELVWVVRRITDDKLWGVWPTRHAAVGWLSTSAVMATNPSQDLEPVAIPAGSYRFGDVILKDGGKDVQ